jgi:hypothetical protein
MIKRKLRSKTKLTKIKFRLIPGLTIALAISLCLLGTFLLFSKANTVSAQTQNLFQIGERITYNISFEKYNNAAYAEIYVVSDGKLSGKDAVQLQAKLKSVDLFSAAFYLFDEVRTSFVGAESGLPLYVRSISNAGVLPKEKIDNFLTAPTSNYDLLSVIFKVRNSGGAGSFSVQEDGQVYNFDFTSTGGETVKTDAGEFVTTISSVQSRYLSDLGITDFRINFTNDEKNVPVLIKFKTSKGNFIAAAASIQNLAPVIKAENTPTPTPQVVIVKTPVPIPTPTPYIKNQKLNDELSFVLGETLIYKVSQRGNDVGTVQLQARERIEFEDKDSLSLVAKVTNTSGNVLTLNDEIEAKVDPFTLAPIQIDFKLKNDLSKFNQSTSFDQTQGIAINNGNKRIDIPVGTHSILSLAYAVRSFNLKPSLDPKNPVNDTRVAVFLGDQPYIFTLRPQKAEIINLKGEKIGAQLVTIRTGNRTIDSLNLRIWLSNDSKRLPLRLMAGNYQADLVETKIVKPK